MINMQINLEKKQLHKKIKETLVLMELGTERKKQTTNKKQKLNIALAIDVSGSMDEAVKRKYEKIKVPVINPQAIRDDIFNQKMDWMKAQQWPKYDPNVVPYTPTAPISPMPLPMQEIEKLILVNSESKISQAKKAAIEAIKLMKDGDMLSVVLFSSSVSVLQSAIELNSQTRLDIINKIQTITARGGTNLHEGWLVAATEVAKKMSSDAINRVIMLTDGQANEGIRSIEQIAENVSGLYQKTISTTTFGIGDGFNEDLLQKMAISGGGNFYYINNDNLLTEMFMDEFNGLNNICATEIKVKFELSELVTKVENLNDFKMDSNSGEYILPDIKFNSKMSGLFKFELNLNKKAKQYNLGVIHISVKLHDGTEQKISNEIKVDCISEKEWNELPFYEELKVQEMLLVVAKNKEKAMTFIDRGNVEMAKTLLTQSAQIVGNCGYADDRLNGEINQLNQTLCASSSMSSNEFRKDISYQSYKSKFSR